MEQEGIEVIGTSLIAYTALPFEEVPAVDWIFFYSKKGVQFFLEGLIVPLSPTIHLATMGAGTASVLIEHGYQPTFIGTGEPDSTAKYFLEYAAAQKVLFPRAKASRRSIQRILKQQIEAYDLVVYNNTPKTSFHIPVVSCLVFTSPLNAQIYFSHHSYNGQLVIAIGPTTAKALEKLNIPCKMAISPTESDLILAVLEK